MNVLRHIDAHAQPAAGSARAALFLDRDGVINEDRGYVHDAANTRFLPGIFDVCRAAANAGALLVVTTNQAGIARGYYDVDTFLAYTRWVHAQFEAHGVPLAATYFCPHHPDAGLGALRVHCDCRKPAPGMLDAAIAEFGIDPARSMMLGDKAKDIEAARAAGLRSALLVGDDPAPGGTQRVADVAHAIDVVSHFFQESGEPRP